jgi:glycosyltransferase involved in cell wall biosynthesis
VHVLHVFSTFDPGGPEVRTAELIRRLPPSFEHSILAMDGRYGCRSRVPKDRVREWLGPPPARGLALPARLRRLIAARSPDLVATYNWGAIEAVLACWLARIPVIHHEEGFGPEEVLRQKTRRVLARRLLLRTAKRVVVPSLALARIASSLWRLPASLVQLLPNGVDLARFCPGDRAAARTALGIPEAALVVGSVGRLAQPKNQQLLLRAFAPLSPTCRLLLVGAGPDLPELRKTAESLGVAERVHFAGAMEDPLPAYRAMDVYAASSTTEQMPVTVLEAMAVGLPVVSTDTGDVRSMVSEQNRRFVVPASRLGEMLLALAADRGLRRVVGAANRKHCARTYAVERMVDAYARLYGEAARRDRDRPSPCAAP